MNENYVILMKHMIYTDETEIKWFVAKPVRVHLQTKLPLRGEEISFVRVLFVSRRARGRS